jgi:Divergent InlB B-repeat domain
VSPHQLSAFKRFEGGLATRTAFAVLLFVACLALPAVAKGGTLRVEFPGGPGHVTSDDGRVDCSDTCDTPIPPDINSVTLTATATHAPTYVFGTPDPQGYADRSGWSVCDEVPGSPSKCTAFVSADGTTTVEANFRPGSLLLLVANGIGGSVTATVPDPQRGELAEQTCLSDAEGGVVCPYAYLPGRLVTLTPSPLNAFQPVWSDEDCFDAAPCTVVLDDTRRSITATFATQRVLVRMADPGVVTFPDGSQCPENPDDDFPVNCSRDFPTGTDVALTAHHAGAKWLTDPQPTRAGCDYVDATGTVCHVIADRSRWTVSYTGAVPDDTYPPTAGSHFAVRKVGDGSGTVRGGGIDCGSRCSTDTNFGEHYVLVAEASSGSTFVGWHKGCGTNPRCPVPVGPISRMTAEFARVSSNATSSESSNATPAPKPTVKKLLVALGRVSVRRSRGRYRIVLPLRLNLAATVTARVSTRRGRRVASHRWKLAAGNRRLTMRVRASRGRYRLFVTIRSSDGQLKNIKPHSLRFR